MPTFSGSEAFSYPRSFVAGKLSDASFLASCVADATVRTATATEAEWTAKSPFSFTGGTIATTLTVVEHHSGERLRLNLVNRTAGASLHVTCEMRFGETGVDWSAEIVSRTGLLKIVPMSVLTAQVEKALLELWADIRVKLAEAFGQPHST